MDLSILGASALVDFPKENNPPFFFFLGESSTMMGSFNYECLQDYLVRME
jgi:hypothetical protein